MLEYPWNEKNNTFTWLSSLYNPFKSSPISCSFLFMQASASVLDSAPSFFEYYLLKSFILCIFIYSILRNILRVVLKNIFKVT